MQRHGHGMLSLHVWKNVPVSPSGFLLVASTGGELVPDGCAVLSDMVLDWCWLAVGWLSWCVMEREARMAGMIVRMVGRVICSNSRK